MTTVPKASSTLTARAASSTSTAPGHQWQLQALPREEVLMLTIKSILV